MRYPGFLRTFGSRLGAGLADELLDRWFPPPPSFLQRFAEAFVEHAPAICHFIEQFQPSRWNEGEPAAPADPSRGVAWAPGCEPLGEFTCPKCGGHTWSTMGADENGAYMRYCTNGLETAYGPGRNPNTVTTPCMFQWKATEDHLYFAPPSPDDVRRSTETATCDSPSGRASPSQAESLANWDRGVDWGRPVLGVTANAVEDAYAALVKAIGNRFTCANESLGHAAARLLTEADAFIKKQSDKIADLMLDNVFPAGKGEIGFMLTEGCAKKLGVAYAPGAPPIRVSLVLDGWQWSVRLGPSRVGGALIPVDWAKADELLRDARCAPASDQTAMAQNAAGGVA